MAWFNRNEPYTFDEELDDADEDCLRAMALLHSRGYAVTKITHHQNLGRNPLQTKQSVEVQTQIGEERLSLFGKPGVALNSPQMSSASSSGQVERRPDVTPMEVEDRRSQRLVHDAADCKAEMDSGKKDRGAVIIASTVCRK